MSLSVALAQQSAPSADAPSDVDLSEVVFGQQFNEPLVHQAVVAYLAGGRQGTKAQKTRSDVRGGGRKPWRQKSTGRARAGSSRSPLWRGGGCTFAARPQDHSVKLNRKMYRGAVRCIFSDIVRHDRLIVVPPSSLIFDTPKTKALVAKLSALELDNVLIIAAQVERNLYLSARNLHSVEVCDAEAINPVLLMSYEKVLVTTDALKAIEERLTEGCSA